MIFRRAVAIAGSDLRNYDREQLLGYIFERVVLELKRAMELDQVAPLTPMPSFVPCTRTGDAVEFELAWEAYIV